MTRVLDTFARNSGGPAQSKCTDRRCLRKPGAKRFFRLQRPRVGGNFDGGRRECGGRMRGGRRVSAGESAAASEDGEGEDASTDVPDARDFAAVYEASAGRLRAYAVSLLRGAGLADQAEDVVQDAILALWKRFQVTDEVPDDWFAVMMNKVKFRALDLMRSAPVRRAGFSLDDDDVFFDVVAPRDFAADLADAGPPRAALDALDDPQQRDVLYRLYYEDKTQVQVARELGLTAGRITQIKQAGLAAVAEYIDRQERR